MATEIPLYREPIETVPTDPVDRVIRYHIQTKHHFNRYARALGYLDWANQPDPFRRFEGAPLISLPLLKPDDGLLRSAHSDSPAFFQADSASANSKNLESDRTLRGWQATAPGW